MAVSTENQTSASTFKKALTRSKLAGLQQQPHTAHNTHQNTRNAQTPNRLQTFPTPKQKTPVNSQMSHTTHNAHTKKVRNFPTAPPPPQTQNAKKQRLHNSSTHLHEGFLRDVPLALWV